MLVRGVGVGLSIMPAMTAAFSVLSRDQVNDASPQLTVLQRVGGSLGTAIIAVVLQGQITGLERTASPAAAGAFAHTYWWVMGVTLVALIPTLLLARIERRPSAHVAAIPVAIRRGPPAGGRMTPTSSARPSRSMHDRRVAPRLRQLLGAERRLRAATTPPRRADDRADSGDDGARPRHEITAGQLAKSADLNPATMTAMLDQLEAANVVERRRSTEDRRVCNVSLTPEGWELLERKLAGWQRLWSERLSGFSDKDIETATAIVHEVTGILDTVASSLDPAEANSALARRRRLKFSGVA